MSCGSSSQNREPQNIEQGMLIEEVYAPAFMLLVLSGQLLQPDKRLHFVICRSLFDILRFDKCRRTYRPVP